MRRLCLLVVLGLLLAGAAHAAPCRPGPDISRSPAIGSPFAQRDVTRLDTQTSDNVAITGGCIDPGILNGAEFSASSYRGATSGALCKWNSTDDVGDCIQGAINAATAAGGGRVVVPNGTYKIAATLTISDFVTVWGAGAGANASTPAAMSCATTLVWSGASGGKMVQVGDASLTAVRKQAGIGNLCLNGNDVAGYGIYMRGVNRGVYAEMVIVGTTTTGFDMDVATGGSVGGMQFNDFRNIFIGLRSAGAASARGMVLGPGSTISDINHNNFYNVRIATDAGDAFVCGNADRNTFMGLEAVPLSGNSRLKAGNSASPLTNCRKNTFIGATFGGSSAGGLIVEGTDVDVAPSTDNIIMGFAKGGAEPNIQAGTSATVYCWDTAGNYCENATGFQRTKNSPIFTADNSGSLTLTRRDCGGEFSNNAAGTQTFVLPAATGSGCIFTISKLHLGTTVTVQTAGAPDIISQPGSLVNNTNSGGYIYTNRVNSTVRIQDISTGKWLIKYGAGTWLTDTGMPVGIGGITLFNSQTASASATLEFSSLPALVDTFVLTCSALVPATDAVNALIEVSTDNTSTWKTANYVYTMAGQNTGGAVAPVSSTAAAAIQINASAINSSATNPLSFKAYLHNLGSSAANKTIQFESAYENDAGPVFESITGAGKYTGNQVVINAVRFRFSSGNITSGQCGLYAAVP